MPCQWQTADLQGTVVEQEEQYIGKSVILMAIASQAAKAWQGAISIAVGSLVKSCQLNALSEIISSRINEAIVNFIQTCHLQKLCQA